MLAEGGADHCNFLLDGDSQGVLSLLIDVLELPKAYKPGLRQLWARGPSIPSSTSRHSQGC